jgi:alpha-amylase
MFKDMSILGVFVDNHDKKRFMNYFKGLNLEDDEKMSALLNTLTFIYMTKGIPIVYYGTERLLNGGDDPHNREVYNPYNNYGGVNIVKL